MLFNSVIRFIFTFLISGLILSLLIYAQTHGRISSFSKSETNKINEEADQLINKQQLSRVSYGMTQMK